MLSSYTSFSNTKWLSTVLRQKTMTYIILIFSMILTSRAPAKDINYCAKGIPLDFDDEFGYRPRGDRCEGLYNLPVGGAARIAIESLTQHLSLGDLDNRSHILLRWRVPTPTPVRLTAVSERPRIRYRMDVLLPASASEFRWSTEVVGHIGLEGDDIGLVGTARIRIAGIARDVYVPVTAGPGIISDGSIEIVFVADVDLAALELTIRPIDARGAPEAASFHGKFGGPFVPAEVPIKVTLAGSEWTAAGGFFHVTAFGQAPPEMLDSALPSQAPVETFLLYLPARQ